jgi:hypothetical protein
VTDLSQLPPLHPLRIKAALELTRSGGTPEERDLAEVTARKALEVVGKIQAGFGFTSENAALIFEGSRFVRSGGEIVKGFKKYFRRG